jgi:hypothetical protein
MGCVGEKVIDAKAKHYILLIVSFFYLTVQIHFMHPRFLIYSRAISVCMLKTKFLSIGSRPKNHLWISIKEKKVYIALITPVFFI